MEWHDHLLCVCSGLCYPVCHLKHLYDREVVIRRVLLYRIVSLPKKGSQFVTMLEKQSGHGFPLRGKGEVS